MNAKSILDGSSDSYMYMPHCASDEGQYTIVNLSDDIVIENIMVSNQEDFSAQLSRIHVEGSIDYPATSWYSLLNLT